MALIVCKHCGKSVSDTRENCIFCGGLLKGRKERQKEIVVAPTPIVKERKTKNYDSLSLEEKQQLEKDFLKQDKRALSYRRKTRAYDAFNGITYLGLACIVLILVVTNVFFNGVERDPNKEIYEKLSMICLVVLFVGLLGLRIAGWTIEAISKNSVKYYVYLKKYQKWLLAKNIEYIPAFKKEKQKEIFNQVDLKIMDC